MLETTYLGVDDIVYGICQVAQLVFNVFLLFIRCKGRLGGECGYANIILFFSTENEPCAKKLSDTHAS